MEHNYTVSTRINRPLAEVFVAVIDRDVLSRYFTTRSSGSLVEGQHIDWFWEHWGENSVFVNRIVERKQISNGVGVLGAVQPVNHRPAQIGRRRRGLIECGLEPGGETVVGGRFGSATADRWHRLGPELPHHLLPDPDLGGHVTDLVERHRLERKLGDTGAIVVTGDTVLIEEGPLPVRGGQADGALGRGDTTTGGVERHRARQPEEHAGKRDAAKHVMPSLAADRTPGRRASRHSDTPDSL